MIAADPRWLKIVDEILEAVARQGYVTSLHGGREVWARRMQKESDDAFRERLVKMCQE